MVLGMSLATFTLLHVIISLIAIVAGLVVMFGMLGSQPQPGLTAIFLLFTILTSVTGFLFPFTAVAIAHGRHSLAGAAGDRLHRALRHEAVRPWRWIYVLTALISLYFNVFVLVIQSFLKIPALTRGGAGQSAGRAGVRGGAGHRAGVLCPRDHRCVAAFQADGVRLTGIKSF